MDLHYKSSSDGGEHEKQLAMVDPIVIWDLEDDPDGNYVHIVVEHDISQDEVEEVVGDASNSTVPSDSSAGR